MKDVSWNLKQWIAEKGFEKGFKKWFRKDNLLVLVLVGILLVIIALPGENSTKEQTQEDSGNGDPGQGQDSWFLGETEKKEESSYKGEAELPEGQGDSGEDYAACLEEKLTEALSQMSEVGKVRVMITLKSSRELVVEKEQPNSRSTTKESDAQGGSRIISQTESEEKTVYSTNGSISEPYVVKTIPPQIEGVLVVAQGAGSGTVNRTIVEIVQALFGVEAHKVKVVKMDSIYYSEGSYNEVVKGEERNESEKPN